MKNLMIGALAALYGLLALPVMASAEPLHVSPTPESLSVTGGASELSRVSGGGATGTWISGSGIFQNTTTGIVNFTFHHVTASGLFTCTTPGLSPGTVETTTLPFHLVTIEKNLVTANPGILVTPNPTFNGEGKAIPDTTHFITMYCGIFVGNIVVKGNGLLGRITNPACNNKGTAMTVQFSGSAGVQNPLRDGTGNEYSLESSISGGSGSPLADSALTAEVTINLGFVQKELVCT